MVTSTAIDMFGLIDEIDSIMEARKEKKKKKLTLFTVCFFLFTLSLSLSQFLVDCYCNHLLRFLEQINRNTACRFCLRSDEKKKEKKGISSFFASLVDRCLNRYLAVMRTPSLAMI